MTPVSHKLELTRGSLRFLHQMIAAPGWAKTIQDIMLGGKLLAETLPPFEAVPEKRNTETPTDYDKRVKAWNAEAAAVFEITEKDREACKRALEHFAREGAIPPNEHSAKLLAAFGYAAE